MFEILETFIIATYDLSNAMAIYILFGLIFAGLLHEIIPDSIVTKHLGSDTVGSVVKSTIFGIPLPVCSCGVIPIATSIKKSGASKGATLSFLISTPITGVDSILATFGMFGWVFTIYRVITSMIIAMAAGILANIYGKDEKPTSTFSAAPTAAPMAFSMAKPAVKEEVASCCSNTGKEKMKFSLIDSLTYAFGTLLSDIAKPLFWGLILGALITVAIPDNLGQILTDYTWLSYLIVVAIAVPMYVCATASLPIAAGLVLAGVSPGAAFVFLSAGPATNTVTIGVVKKMLGTRTLAIYLGSIVIGSVGFGLMLDMIFAANAMDIKEIIHIHEEADFLDIASSVILWGFIVYFFVKPFFPKKSESCETGEGSCCSK